MKDIFLSVIIPAYNEQDRIPSTLIDVDRYLSTVDYPYEIIAVNDGSTDRTAEVIVKLSLQIKNMKIIDYKVNEGKGAAVRRGMVTAKGKYRLLMDADNSTSVDQFQNMIPFLEGGFDVVIGSREAKGSRMDPPQPWYRRIPGRAANIIIQLVNVPGIWDTQCGFKAFSAEATDKIFSIARIDRWGFDIEALALARVYGYKIKEVPVLWKNDAFSHVSAGAYLQVFMENLKIRWWIITRSYKLKNQV